MGGGAIARPPWLRYWVKTKKKGLRQKLVVFLSNLGKEWGLFRLIIKRSNLDGETPKFRWEDAKSRWGDANFRWEDASPPRSSYNLSTGF